MGEAWVRHQLLYFRLRRLLNDAEEEKAWDNILELKSVKRSKLVDDEVFGDIS